MQRIQRPVEAIGEIGGHAVDPFDLQGGERRRPLRVAADGIEVRDERLQLLVGGSRRPARPAGPASAGRDENATWTIAMTSVATAITPRKTSPQSFTRSPARGLLIRFAAALDGGGQRLAPLR